MYILLIFEIRDHKFIRLIRIPISPCMLDPFLLATLFNTSMRNTSFKMKDMFWLWHLLLQSFWSVSLIGMNEYPCVWGQGPKKERRISIRQLCSLLFITFHPYITTSRANHWLVLIYWYKIFHYGSAHNIIVKMCKHNIIVKMCT